MKTFRQDNRYAGQDSKFEPTDSKSGWKNTCNYRIWIEWLITLEIKPQETISSVKHVHFYLCNLLSFTTEDK